MFGMNQHDNAKLRGLHPANAAGVGEHFMQHLCKATCITAQSGISKPASAFAFSLRGCQDSLMQLPLHAKMPDMRSCAMSAATLSSAWAVQTIRHSCRRSSSCPTLGASLGRLDRRQGTSLSGASQVVTDLKLNPCTGSSMRICSLQAHALRAVRSTGHHIVEHSLCFGKFVADGRVMTPPSCP